MVAEEELKLCSRCGEPKPIHSAFHWIVGRNGKRRPYSYCKPCGLTARRENSARKKAGDTEDKRTKESKVAHGIVRTEVSEKRCGRCGLVKPVKGNFYRVNKGKGWSGYCIPCTKEAVVEWQKANPEKKAAADRKQNQKPERKAKNNERGRRRHAADPKKANSRSAAWQIANRERCNQRSAKWRAAHLGAARASQRKHYWTKPGRRERCMDHARLHHAFHKDQAIYGPGGEKLDRAFWLRLLDVFNNRCCFCDADGPMTIEHLTPFKRGGRNANGNIAPACAKCNDRKRAKTAEQFCPARAPEIRRKATLMCEALAA